MSGTSVLNQGIPFPTTPMYDTETGVMSLSWYQFFLALFYRTGGPTPGGAGVPGGLVGNVQYNNSGTFGGLTDIQLTARIQDFTDVLSGAAPPSGGGTVNYLRADGAWFNPPGTLYSASTGLTLLGTTFSLDAPVAVANGGTGLSVGTSGGVLGYTAAGVLASSVALTNHAIVLGRGAGATPVPLASLGTTTTVLHGAAAGDPTFGAVSLTADVSGTLLVANGGTGVTTSTGTPGNTVLSGNPTLAGATVDGDGALALTSQVSGAGAAVGTLNNAPTAGDPAFWLKLSVNGTTYKFPGWS